MGISDVFSILKLVYTYGSQYKKYIICLIVAIALIGGTYYEYKKITNEFYQQGVAFQKGIYQKEQDKLQKDLDAKQKVADADRAALNSQLNTAQLENDKLKQEQAVKSVTILNEATKYEEDNKNIGSCFGANDSGLLLLQRSFPSSAD